MAETSEHIRKIKKWLVYPLEAILVYFFYYLFQLMPMTWAAGIGALLCRSLGPLFKAHQIALDNLKMAFPEKSDKERQAIAKEVWDNLGRNGGEYMKLTQLSSKGDNPRIFVEGEEHLLKAQEESGRFILFSAHMANWEVCPITIADYGIDVAAIYRKTSNPYVDVLVRNLRSHYSNKLIPKGRAGARQLITTFKEGTPLAVLVDQKLNEGVSVPFFGKECMTPTAAAELSIRFDCPLLPMQIIRLPGSKFKVKIYPPMEKQSSGDLKADSYELLCRVNGMIEEWVTEHPGQWLWVHRRWPKE